MKKVSKRGVVSEYLPWLLIAMIVLVIVVISIFILRQKGVSLLGQIKNLFGGH